MATLLKHNIRRCQKLLALLLLFSTCEAPEFPKPKITSIDPLEAIPGKLIEIKGEVLNTVTEVSFAGIGTREFWMHDTKKDVMNVFVPRETKPGKVDVMLKSPQGNSSPYAMTVLPLLPTITRIEPISARIGQTITVIGENFTSDTEVSFPKGTKVDGNFISSSVLTVKIPEDEVSGMVTLSNQLGTSKDGFHYEIINPDASTPTIDEIRPIEPFVGETVVIKGSNFFADETTVALSGKPLLMPTELTLVSTTEMRFTVPAGATSGPLTVENSFGTFTTNLPIQMPPAVERILPKANARGGPIIIYGTNLKNVEQIQIGAAKMLKPEFTFLKDNIGRDVLYGRVPAAKVGAAKVKVGNLRGIVSNEYDFFVNSGEVPLPTGFTSITYPNVLVPPTLISMSNSWTRNFGSNRITLADGDVIGDDLKAIVTPDDGAVIGYFEGNGNQITMRIDTALYEGRLDSKYGNGSLPYRLVLTPVWGGSQIELIYPAGLDGTNPTEIKKGGTTVITGKYFYDGDGFTVHFDETEVGLYDESFNPNAPYYKRLSDFKLELTIPSDASKGTHDVTVRFNTFDKSNTLNVTVTN